MNIDRTIRDVVKGDSFQVIRNISGVPDEETVNKAWFTVKRLGTEPDAEASLQKIVTTENFTDLGIIVNPSPLDGTAVVTFNVWPENWDDIDPDVLYKYDIQVLTSGGAIYTLETGTFMALSGITDSQA